MIIFYRLYKCNIPQRIVSNFRNFTNITNVINIFICKNFMFGVDIYLTAQLKCNCNALLSLYFTENKGLKFSLIDESNFGCLYLHINFETRFLRQSAAFETVCLLYNKVITAFFFKKKQKNKYSVLELAHYPSAYEMPCFNFYPAI